MSVWLQLNGCCFWFKLRTGSLITLWLSLIYSVLGLLNAIYEIQNVGNAPEMILFSVANCAGVVTLGILPCALALYGIYQRRPGYLKLYVFISFVTIICWISITVALVFRWIPLNQYKDSMYSVIFAIILASFTNSCYITAMQLVTVYFKDV